MTVYVKFETHKLVYNDKNQNTRNLLEETCFKRPEGFWCAGKTLILV
jgi:hypothetical protein